MDNMSDPQLDEQLKLKVLMATAIRQAMNEVIGEQREEIIKRARAKLSAMGIEVANAELGAQV